jgi:hypothetical protein
VINDALELEDGSFILLSHEVYPLDQSKAHMIRISPSGKQLDTKTLTFQGSPSGFIKISQIETNLFVLAGYTVINDTTKLWLYKMDSLFNEVQSKILPTGTFNFSFLSDLKVNNGNLLCSGIGTSTTQISYAFIYKISLDLDSIQLKVFTEHLTTFPIDLIAKNTNNGFYCFITHFGPPTTEVILDLDNSFSINQILAVPYDVWDFPEAKWISMSKFILSGRKDYFQYPPNQGIELLCMDTTGNLLHDLFIGDHDTIDWPGLRSRLDFVDTNLIYEGGTHNFCQGSEFCPVHCWFSLNQMDTTLHVNWEHFYGGDANYTMYGIRATKDKGCLMFGSRYDLQSATQQRDIYAIKVNEDGLLLNAENILSDKVKNVILYPTPGSDNVVIESGPQVSGAEFVMSTIDGKEVISKIIQARRMTLNVGFLPAGNYVWQIRDGRGIVETGKWIKNKK